MANELYKNLQLSVRTPRLACFIDSNDTEWEQNALHAIEYFSRTWGGAYFIIVPTDGTTISDTFWSILLAYDPDYLLLYDRALVENEVEEFELSPELNTRLKMYLAPFHIAEHVATYIGAGMRIEFPLTALSTILPNTEHAEFLKYYPELPEGISILWAASVTGRNDAESLLDFERAGMQLNSVSFDGKSLDLIKTVVKGIYPLRYDEQDSSESFGFGLSLINLSFINSIKFNEWDEPVVVIYGSSLDDFCLYYCLGRMRMRVAWLPAEWTESAPNKYHLTNFVQALRSLNGSLGRYRKIVLLSLSQPENLGDVRSALNNTGSVHLSDIRLPEEGINKQASVSMNGDIRAHVDAILGQLLLMPYRVVETNNFARSVDKHFIDGRMAGALETIRPKNFRNLDAYEHRWITEVSIRSERFPRHPLLGNVIVGHPQITTSGARVAESGICYFSPSPSHIGGDLDLTIINPSIYLPSGFELFHTLLKHAFYDSRLSDKGSFAFETINRFGDLYRLVQFFKDDETRSLLETFLKDRKKLTRRELGYIEGGIFLDSDRRRYLDFVAIEQFVGNSKRAADLIDDLVSRQIFHRGFIFKCSLCRSADWFGVGEISHEFRCRRCSRTQVYTQRHSLGKHEPTWYYKLDEIVFRGLEHNIIVPTLTLGALRRSTESFIYSPELEVLNISSGEQLFEIDICCVPDGVLTIGEAKKADSLASTAREENKIIDNYYRLAKEIGATQVVFSTYSESWKESSVGRIKSKFTDPLIKVRLLTHDDLFSK
jgi:hypothetical protein